MKGKKIKVELTPELKERLAELRKCDPSRQEFYDFLDSLEGVMTEAFLAEAILRGWKPDPLEARVAAAVWIDATKEEFKGLKE
jgi:hypothetical protein